MKDNFKDEKNNKEIQVNDKAYGDELSQKQEGQKRASRKAKKARTAGKNKAFTVKKYDRTLSRKTDTYENSSRENRAPKKSRKTDRNGFYLTERGKKIYIPIWASLGLLFIVSIILICTIKPASPSLEDKTKSGWPVQSVAPFVDMSAWVPLSNQFSNNGVPNLTKVEEQTGLNYYNIGFIQPDQTTPLDSSGNIRWGWGGLYELSEKGNDGYQYPKIKQTLKSLKDMGAMYTISIGGQLGKAPWIVTTSVDKLEAFYLEIIDLYDLKRIDLDIEESNQTESNNIVNAQAIKRVQDKTGVEVVLTIPIMPSGWTDKQIKIIKAYLSQGVNLSLINSMTMCYGTGVYANEDYGDASVRAIENSVKQMQEIWASFGTSLTEEQAYRKTGATVDIGYESDLYPIFTPEMTRKVVNHAKEKGYGMLSYWSINRDAKMETNKGVTNQYEFLNELNYLYK